MKVTPVGTTATGAGRPPVNGKVTEPIKLVEATANPYQEPLIVSTYGSPGSGKSRLIGTAPDPIGLIPVEHKSRQTVVNVANEFGKKVIAPEQDLIRVSNPLYISNLPKTCIVVGDAKHANWKPGEIQDEMQAIADTIRVDSPSPSCCQRHYYRWHVNRVKSVIFRLADDPAIRTLAIDPFGTLVADISYANYGLTGVIDPKEFGFAPREDLNKEIRELLNAISHKHLILTHHLSAVWKDGKPVPGMTKPDNLFGKIGHYTSVMIEQGRDDEALKRNKLRVTQGRPDNEMESVYWVSVVDCQANASIIGQDILFDEGISFQALALRVYPDADIEAFE